MRDLNVTKFKRLLGSTGLDDDSWAARRKYYMEIIAKYQATSRLEPSELRDPIYVEIYIGFIKKIRDAQLLKDFENLEAFIFLYEKREPKIDFTPHRHVFEKLQEEGNRRFNLPSSKFARQRERFKAEWKATPPYSRLAIQAMGVIIILLL